MATGNAEQHLKKHVGFLGLLAMCVGLNIGGALFALTTVAAGFSGPSLPLAMLVSAVPVLLAIVPYVTLTSVIPTTSASYRYSQLFSPSVAIVSLFTLLVCMLIGGQPLFALGFGKYLNALLPLDPIWTGIGVLTAFYVINLMGVRLTARIQTVLFFMLLAALILYIVLTGLCCSDGGSISINIPPYWDSKNVITLIMKNNSTAIRRMAWACSQLNFNII